MKNTLKTTLLTGMLLSVGQTWAAEVVLEKNGVTLTDVEMLAAASDLSENELKGMRENNAMLRHFIEQQFDDKVMAAGIAEELKKDKNYPILSDMVLAKFGNQHYIKQKVLEKIDAVKDFKTLAKQSYHSNIKDYQGPQTYDYYHILFVKQDGEDSKAKADALLADIEAGKITLADAAKANYSAVAGTDAEGVLKNIQPEKLMDAIQKAVLGMSVGDVSQVIETAAGYHIVGLKQVNEIETIPYDEKIEEKIIVDLKNKIYRTMNREIRDQYRGPEGLTVNEALLDKVSKTILAPKKP